MEHPLHASFIFVYLLVLVGVGAMQARKITDQEGFALAGRGLPTWVLVGTLLATWVGTGSIVANAEYTFTCGAPAVLVAFPLAVASLVLVSLATKPPTDSQATSI